MDGSLLEPFSLHQASVKQKTKQNGAWSAATLESESKFVAKARWLRERRRCRGELLSKEEVEMVGCGKLASSFFSFSRLVSKVPNVGEKGGMIRYVSILRFVLP